MLVENFLELLFRIIETRIPCYKDFSRSFKSFRANNLTGRQGMDILEMLDNELKIFERLWVAFSILLGNTPREAEFMSILMGSPFAMEAYRDLLLNGPYLQILMAYKHLIAERLGLGDKTLISF